MKKLYIGLFTLFVFFSFQELKAQTPILTFSFAGINGNEATINSSSNTTGVQTSVISRTGVAASAGATPNRFNSVQWPLTATYNNADYLEFKVTPAAGYSLTISSLEIQSQASASGPKFMVVKTSADGFSSATSPVALTSTTSTSSVALNLSSSSAITIRLYAYKATTSTGAWGPGSSSDGNDLLIYGSQIVLPVKLANFKATQKNTHTDIEWSNLTESEVLNYSVERSPDGRSFEKIITVNVLKNNGSRADYHVTDNEPLAGINFYRIKALEKTGRIYYTNVIKLDLGSLNTYLDLYPNPTSYGSAISMQLNNLPKGSYVLNIYSIGGQLAHKETFASAGGSLNQQLSVPKLNKGSYFVFVEGAVKLQKKLIIQ